MVTDAMITRLHSVMPTRSTMVVDAAPTKIVTIVYWSARDDEVYWCGSGNGHDGQGWTADRREATEYLTFAEGAAARRDAKRAHPRIRVGLRNEESTR